jgi:hypothetical protein
MSNECGAVGGMRIDGGKEEVSKNPLQCQFLHYNYSMTKPGI